jgi:nitrate/TMAO reductase-like tetraheme cytochrome c subunit
VNFVAFGRRIRDRAPHIVGVLFIASLFALAGTTAGSIAFMHYTARNEFCNSCHIMEPFYRSWQEGKHKDVACIDCHYAPGVLEPLNGKFKALTQLVKYVTRTAGTKPWAEVSDQSCLRSGCHAVPVLDRPLMFGEVRFDHRQHLLDIRPGHRLRCTTCHAQISMEQHVAVSPTVCVACHFMPPGDDPDAARKSECTLCHSAPSKDINVAGRTFQHAAYIDRGVACKNCHEPTFEGDGKVRQERCKTCHGEPEYNARIGETVFLHDRHVLEHKVECFQCHDEIHHGLMPLARPETSKSEGCGACHVNPHSAALAVYAGTGAAGVDDKPSRMYQTRVACQSCHTGRSGFLATFDGDAPDTSRPPITFQHGGAHGNVPTVAVAGNVDCIHCHGTGYDGLLAEWQSAVKEQVDRLGPIVSELKQELQAAPDSPARAPLREAEQNLQLVQLDGSHGAHNVSYSLGALRAGADRIDAVRKLLGIADAPSASIGFPAHSKDGCTDCHAGAGRPETIWKGEHRFPHQRHLATGMECSACHSVVEHGRPAFPRDQCANCHHQESDTRDANDCASCHAPQEQLLRGTVAGFAEKPGAMSKMECSECHGEAPDIIRPTPNSCVVCHKPGYDQMSRDWQQQTTELSSRVEKALAGAGQRGIAVANVDSARRAFDAVAKDGSGGAHNFEFTKALLEQALQELNGP